MRHFNRPVTLLLASLIAVGILIGTPHLTAHAQDTLEPGAVVESIYSGDPVRYTVEAAGGQLLLVEATSSLLDLKLTLYDANGYQITSDDDGGLDDDPLLAYVVPTSGSYIVEVETWFDDEGTFSISAELVAPLTMDVNSTVTLPPNEADPLFVVFPGTMDSVVNLHATSQSDDDIKLTLYDANGSMLAEDDDYGPDRNPYLRRVILPSDGSHLVKISSVFDEALTGPVDVTLESTEQLFPTDTPHEVTLSESELGLEVFSIEATAGTIYRITVAIADGTGVELELQGTGDFLDPGVEVSRGTRVSWDYQASETGLLRLVVLPEFFSDGDTFNVSLEVVE